MAQLSVRRVRTDSVGPRELRCCESGLDETLVRSLLAPAACRLKSQERWFAVLSHSRQRSSKTTVGQNRSSSDAAIFWEQHQHEFKHDDSAAFEADTYKWTMTTSDVLNSLLNKWWDRALRHLLWPSHIPKKYFYIKTLSSYISGKCHGCALLTFVNPPLLSHLLCACIQRTLGFVSARVTKTKFLFHSSWNSRSSHSARCCALLMYFGSYTARKSTTSLRIHSCQWICWARPDAAGAQT